MLYFQKQYNRNFLFKDKACRIAAYQQVDDDC